MTIMRPWRFVLTAAAVLLLVLVPSADMVAFGPHEHVMVTPERGGDLTGAESIQDPTLSHHCELSVSVGELLPVVELPTPVVVMVDPREPHASTPQHRPFVPLTPPRS